jgi:putative DNA primase/helicase
VVIDPASRVQSSVLHGVFVGWARAVGEYEWKNKGFTQAMKAKGFKTRSSNGMQFEGVRLIKSADDFIDEHGMVRDLNGGSDAGRGSQDDDPGPPAPDLHDDFGDGGTAWNV